MKKIICILLSIIMTAGFLSACGDSTSTDSDKLSIVTTIFPEYDWVAQIVGDKADAIDLTLLLDNGVDLHSYQPTADDIVKISSCDLFIYVGGESDAWVDDALKEAINKDMIVIDLLEVLGDSVKEEEVVEGMEAEDEEEEEEGPEYDEHVWLSLRNAVILVKTIEEAIAKLDADNADAYKTNADSFIEKLEALDEEYKNTVENAKYKTLLFGDRFPFRYMTDDYGLEYYAAFVGCSAESEASFETISFLAGKVDELGLPAVVALEGTDHRIAETVIASTKNKSAEIVSMDSMQSVTSADVENGTSYLSIMEKNLSVLKDALN